MGKINTPEGVPRLFDLIKSKDDKYLTAFYFALRDTLVANDLEQATRSVVFSVSSDCINTSPLELRTPTIHDIALSLLMAK